MYEAEKYKVEDEAQKKTVEARNALDKYVYDLRKGIKNYEISSRKSFVDKRMIEDVVKQTSQWLNESQWADTEEFEDNMEELACVCRSIIVKMQRGGYRTVFILFHRSCNF